MSAGSQSVGAVVSRGPRRADGELSGLRGSTKSKEVWGHLSFGGASARLGESLRLRVAPLREVTGLRLRGGSR